MQCTYKYADDYRCVAVAENGIDRCEEHKKVTRRVATRQNVAKRFPEVGKPVTRSQLRKPPPARPEYYDHTTPWICGLSGCDICKNKPTYDEYMSKYKKEKA